MIINLTRLESAGRPAIKSIVSFVSDTVANICAAFFTWVTYLLKDTVPYKESNSYTFSKKTLTSLLLGHEMPGLQDIIPAIYISIKLTKS